MRSECVIAAWPTPFSVVVEISEIIAAACFQRISDCNAQEVILVFGRMGNEIRAGDDF